MLLFNMNYFATCTVRFPSSYLWTLFLANFCHHFIMVYVNYTIDLISNLILTKPMVQIQIACSTNPGAHEFVQLSIFQFCSIFSNLRSTILYSVYIGKWL